MPLPSLIPLWWLCAATVDSADGIDSTGSGVLILVRPKALEVIQELAIVGAVGRIISPSERSEIGLSVPHGANQWEDGLPHVFNSSVSPNGVVSAITTIGILRFGLFAGLNVTEYGLVGLKINLVIFNLVCARLIIERFMCPFR